MSHQGSTLPYRNSKQSVALTKSSCLAIRLYLFVSTESLDAKEVVKDVISNGSKTAKHDSVNSDEPEGVITHWLMKSEPESRFENGVDVKASILVILYQMHKYLSLPGYIINLSSADPLIKR